MASPIGTQQQDQVRINLQISEGKLEVHWNLVDCFSATDGYDLITEEKEET